MTTDVIGPWEGKTVAGGRYHSLTTIGVGGMGYVYRAVDRNLKTEVVIKSPRAALVEGPELADRFEQEVGALVRLSFPHIVPIIDIGRHEGVSFAVMRYLPGGNLISRAIVGEDGRPAPMPWQNLRYWLPSIAKALDFVHRSQFVHRDVKPRNILFDEHGQAYLSDFGIIKGIGLTATGETRFRTAEGINVGTVDYMAPEVLLNQTFDGRADQYSLALTVYEYLTGRLPPAGDSLAEIIDSRLNRVPPRIADVVSEVPAAISQAVARALSKQPADRFASCGDFAKALLGNSMTSIDQQLAPFAARPASQPAPRPAAAGETRLVEAPRSRSSTRRFLSSRFGALTMALLFVCGAAAVLAMTLELDEATSTPTSIEPDPLARRISQWKQKAGDVERARTIDSAPVLEKLEYRNADELQQMLKSQAAMEKRDYLGLLDELEGELTGIAQLHREQATKIVAIRQSVDAQDSEKVAALAAANKELEDQTSEITTMAHRMRSLRDKSSSLDAYDAPAMLELTQLNEMETVSAAREIPEISAACIQRSLKLSDSRNGSLSWTAINVLARSQDPAASQKAASRLSSFPPDRQATLCRSLLLSHYEPSITAALRQFDRRPEVFELIPRADLMELAERDAKAYHGLIDVLVKTCTSPQQRMRLFVAQSQALTVDWLVELESSLTDGLLADHVDEVFSDIILGGRTAAYPLAEKLLERNSPPSMQDFIGDELAPLAEDSPQLAARLAAVWATDTTTALRKAALDALTRRASPLDLKPLQQRIEIVDLRDPEGLLNLLIVMDTPRGAELGEIVATKYKNLNPAKVAYGTASIETLHRPRIRDVLLHIAWQDAQTGRPWAMKQILGAGFLDKFRAAEASREEQLALLGDIVPILNSKLVILRNSAGGASADRGLSLDLKTLLEIPDKLDADLYAAAGPAPKRLAELRQELATVRDGTSREFAGGFSDLDTYLAELQKLTVNCEQICQVYDFTVIQQLPGARRAMRIQPIVSWEFRFASIHISQFERELATYLGLKASLPKLRSAVSLP